jgi:hypothetical protein
VTEMSPHSAYLINLRLLHECEGSLDISVRPCADGHGFDLGYVDGKVLPCEIAEKYVGKCHSGGLGEMQEQQNTIARHGGRPDGLTRFLQ